MRLFAILLSLFLSVTTYAQSNNTARKDTMFVVDGNISGTKLHGIDPHSILTIDVLLTAQGTDKSMGDPDKVIMLITTKKCAVKSYQNKLSTFSKDYKSYLEKNENGDSGLVYLLDGVVLEGKQNEIIKKLYEASEKIRSVDFIEKYSAKLNSNNAKPIVVITTKRKN